MIKSYNEKVVCADGFSMSVQAREQSYCSPRDDFGPYTEVEVGHPSKWDLFLQPYAEDPERPTETIYGWVPYFVVQLCIDSHGGMVSGQLPPRAKTEIT